MAEASFIGELREKPENQHPQEGPLAELYRAKGLGADSGVYAFPVEAKPEVVVAFLTEGKIVTNRLPKRVGTPPIYGLDEVALSPKDPDSVIDLSVRPDLRAALIEGLRERHPGRKIEIQ